MTGKTLWKGRGPRSFFRVISAGMPAILAVCACGLLTPAKGQQLTVAVDRTAGTYTLQARNPRWTWSGSVGAPLAHVHTSPGSDRIGPYLETTFDWKSGHLYTGSIRCYRESPVAMFSLRVHGKTTMLPPAFPAFTTFPDSLHGFSYAERVFAPHQFRLNRTSTPWLFFDGRLHAFVLSPASDFLVASMEGNGIDTIASGLRASVKNLPADFVHRSLLAVDTGIGVCWNDWGTALQKWYGKRRPANDQDAVLKYFGYWTDNGADYYYNYDTTLGYTGTLLRLRQTYREERIPLGYMQLDSWWYDKSIYDPEGRPVAGHKNKKLPDGPWNRYGGTLSYTADPFLFPNGLAAFQRQLGLPLVVHGRWIDPQSPYHSQYRISGLAPVDSAYWQHTAAYLKAAGVICYEQDWLNYIYSGTPAMQSDLDTGNAFTDGMAHAMKARGIDLQYCMLLPGFYLQGLKYDNLTTIRPSSDRFEPGKWRDFIYNSQFTYAVGAWPWCDVFKSHETGNMILAVLSAGAVGTGDSMGLEDKRHIAMAARNDGVLVKPDVPAVPLDASYLRDAEDPASPMAAWTYTDHGALRTAYVFAFSRRKDRRESITLSGRNLGIRGAFVAYDKLSGQARLLEENQAYTMTPGADGYVFTEFAPVTPAGIAFFGDQGKFVGTGKKRISGIQATASAMRITVIFGKGDGPVTLEGYYLHDFTADRGTLKKEAPAKRFTLLVNPPASGSSETVTLRIVH